MRTLALGIVLFAFAAALALALRAGADEAPPREPPPADKPPADKPPAPDAPKTDEPKTDEPKTDEPKTDEPKSDAPKTDAPPSDAPKADGPKVDPVPPKPALRYLGDKSCRSCHVTEHRSWAKLAHAASMKPLGKVTEADDKRLFAARSAAKLDPAKDFSKDVACLACHTTGFGTPSGYSTESVPDSEAAAVLASLGRVACEACHGPGEKYVPFKKANPGRKFTKAELAPLGLVEPDEKVCTECHNEKSPTAKPFSFAEMKTKIHEHKKKSK